MQDASLSRISRTGQPLQSLSVKLRLEEGLRTALRDALAKLEATEEMKAA